MEVRYLLTVCLVAMVAGNPAERAGGRAVRCRAPYEAVGRQCLFFSRPYAAWGIDNSWSGAYKSLWDASDFCSLHGGKLAPSVQDFKAASAFCKSAEGGCAPSWIKRGNSCFFWSPSDNPEREIPCKEAADAKNRFICQSI